MTPAQRAQTDTKAGTQILLVEDDVGIGRLLERGLTGEGYAVDWVRDLQSATEHIRARDPALILLDRMLPDGDGADLCSAIRRMGLKMPICMLTARETLEDKLRGFDAGADEYIVKPFEFDELIARLQVLLRWSSAVPEPVPELNVIAPERSLHWGDTVTKFTQREWPLVAYMLDHVGQDLTRADLIAHAWQMEGEVTENSVDVYVGYLRRKLVDDGLPLRIETVRGVGFRMERI